MVSTSRNMTVESLRSGIRVPYYLQDKHDLSAQNLSVTSQFFVLNRYKK